MYISINSPRTDLSTIIAMNDVLVSTHTGGGKTLSFLVPIIQNLLIEKNSKINLDQRGEL